MKNMDAERPARPSQDAWHDAATRWLDDAFPALVHRARTVGDGAAGVLVVTADLADLEVLTAADHRAIDAPPTAWVEAGAFVARLEAGGGAKAREWADAVASMDPDHQVAVYLQASSAEEDCTWFTLRPVPDDLEPVE
jgi:hypothetical protein